MKSLIDKSPRELVFSGSCVVLLLSVFLPYMDIVVTYNGVLSERTFSIFPSLTGFAMIIIAVLGVLMILAGYRKRVLFLGLANALLFMIRQYLDRSAATNFQHNIDTINQMENIMLNVNKDSVVEWSYMSGYYWMITATILLVCIGAWCFYDRKEEDQED